MVWVVCRTWTGREAFGLTLGGVGRREWWRDTATAFQGVTSVTDRKSFEYVVAELRGWPDGRNWPCAEGCYYWARRNCLGYYAWFFGIVCTFDGLISWSVDVRNGSSYDKIQLIWTKDLNRFLQTNVLQSHGLPAILQVWSAVAFSSWARNTWCCERTKAQFMSAR